MNNSIGNNISLIPQFSPDFESRLVEDIIALEKLRSGIISVTTPKYVFFALKDFFQFIESFGSSRLEGNPTLFEEYVREKLKMSPQQKWDEKIVEIDNIDETLRYIESVIFPGGKIDEAFIKSVHKMLTDRLSTPGVGGEGSRWPGEYKRGDNRVENSSLITVRHKEVDSYMKQLIDYINAPRPSRSDLIAIAVAHHRFTWIHPFDNGNGRVVRALTYAQLIKSGFRVDNGRILNPTAVFCNDRAKYNSMLAGADSGSRDGVLGWVEYMTGGLRVEIEKIDKLTNAEYVRSRVLMPALEHAHRVTRMLNAQEYSALKAVVNSPEMVVSAAEFQSPIGLHGSSLSRVIRRLIERKLIVPVSDGARRYRVNLSSWDVFRSLQEVFILEGFIPRAFNTNKA